MKNSKRRDEFLSAAEVAQILGCDPQGIRSMARDCPERLGFPVIRIGNRTRIPKVPFMRFIGRAE